MKWGSESFPDVELNTDEQPILFKAQLFALTGVQPERQKVICKGKTVNDDSWDAVPVKEVRSFASFLGYADGFFSFQKGFIGKTNCPAPVFLAFENRILLLFLLFPFWENREPIC